jgi:hypothetical protein
MMLPITVTVTVGRVTVELLIRLLEVHFTMVTKDGSNGERTVSGVIRHGSDVEIYYMTPTKIGLWLALDDGASHTIDRHGQFFKGRAPRFVCITDQGLALVLASELSYRLGIRVARNANPGRKVSHAA